MQGATNGDFTPGLIHPDQMIGGRLLADMERPVVNTRDVHGSEFLRFGDGRVGTTDTAGRFDDESR
jgi:hypothetical protein